MEGAPVSPPAAPRVLLSGSPLGRLTTLFKRVAAVNKSNGPFDLLLCVGQFFPSQGGDASAEVAEYLGGRKVVPLPTYFIGDYGFGSEIVQAKMAESSGSGPVEICPNLYFLGRAGIAELSGLRVAFLAGEYDPFSYRAGAGSDASVPSSQRHQDFEALAALANDNERPVDFLLTNEWPRGILEGVDKAEAPAGLDPVAVGSPVAAELAKDLKPRYHIAGTEDVFFARAPYRNRGPSQHVSRFIGLARVGNDKKQKYLHALNPTPSSQLSPADLAAAPPNTTPSPYEPQPSTSQPAAQNSKPPVPGSVLSTGEPEGGQYWRWQEQPNKRQRTDGGDKVCFDFQKGRCERGDKCRYRHDLSGAGPTGRGSESGGPSKGPPGPPAPCWFCLSSPDVETHLVISIAEHSYVALAKGPLIPGHVLVLPIEHHPSLAALPPDVYAEMMRYKDALQKCFAAQNRASICFERYLQLRAGTHAHLQVCPISRSAADKARLHYESAAEKNGFRLVPVPAEEGANGAEQLRNAVGGPGNYFMVELPDETRLLHAIKPGEKLPMQFGREVLADLRGTPERADWRACKLTTEEETEMADAFKEMFKPFDIMET
ncbi:hypothetical protein KFL_000020470 [Klebsormidium nitens]|uniref:Uncharacterized protein n=1 Tax=Klebsormidium nitens TaxID=105231 RepID=A0A1Y1HGX7_KLENI|nr:hypothetical protein KFL_000020470 [Klebsormidium nitens]|eukprot:GAQ77685.1 hypothetical protein KFL_000020470 [Klebsormidium nitens]